MPTYDLDSLDPEDPSAVEAVLKYFKEKHEMDLTREQAEELLWKIKQIRDRLS